MVEVRDVPEIVKLHTLYVIGERNTFWLAVLRCPCGCNEYIQLPLSGKSGPVWALTGSHTRPTLSPSIHRTVGCRSHFFIRGGRISWCAVHGP